MPTGLDGPQYIVDRLAGQWHRPTICQRVPSQALSCSWNPYCKDSASMPESLSCHPVLEIRPPVLEIHNLNWLPCGPNPGLPSCAIAEAQNMVPAFCTTTCLAWVFQQASIDSGLCHMACGPSQSVVSQGCVAHVALAKGTGHLQRVMGCGTRAIIMHMAAKTRCSAYSSDPASPSITSEC